MKTPAVIAILVGFRGRRDRPETPAAFGIGAFWAILFGALFVFAWHVAWLGAAAVASGAAEGLVGGAVFSTLASGVIWFPLLMISYVANAQRGLRA
ncbi:MAG: hypothetical protein ACU0CO_02335 [Shimia sp.]